MVSVCIAVLLVPLLWAGAAYAAVSGSLTWKYGEFEAKDDGQTVLDTSYFSQDYSLMFEKHGYFSEGRAGRYDLGLGYEWTSLDSEVNDANFDVTADKILYRGELTFAPGGLPVRVHAYSRDITRNRLQDGGLPNTILDATTTIGIGNGEHIQTGLTAVLGIKNGSYLGRYRELLSRFPKLYFDYVETYVHDTKGLVPQHNRTRNLAFVSLNKKSNWFHYRYKEYTDYLSGRNDYEERVYMLGTIDHLLKREWINMTNWIKISADGSLTESTDSDDPTGSSNEYRLNLFSIMHRNDFTVGNFNTYSRQSSSSSVRKRADLPVFADGWINPNTSWRTTFISYFDDETFTDAARLTEEEEGQYAAAELEVGHQSRFVLSPEIEVEQRKTENSEGYAARARLEVYNNKKRFSQARNYLLGYTVAAVNGEQGATTGSPANEVEFLEQEIYGEYNQRLSSKHRLFARQNFLYGSGDTSSSVTRYITLSAGNSFDNSGDSSDLTEGDTFRSTTQVTLESLLSPRAVNKFSFFYDVKRTDVENVQQLVLGQHLTYRNSKINAKMINELIFGDGIEVASLDSNIAVRSNTGEVNWAYQHKTSLDYAPLQNFEIGGTFELAWNDCEEGTVWQWRGEEHMQYSLYHLRGLRRKYADFYQRFSYVAYYADDVDADYMEFVFGGNYYPLRMLRLGGEVVYERRSTPDIQTVGVEATVAVLFPKFEWETRYGYGVGENGDGAVRKRREHLVETAIKKTF